MVENTPDRPRRMPTLQRRIEMAWNHPQVPLVLVIGALVVGMWGSFLPFKPGVAVVVLAVVTAVMSTRPKRRSLEKAAWLFVMGFLSLAEIRAITKSSNDNETKMQKIVDGVNKEIDIGSQNLAISQSLLASVELLSRPQPVSGKPSLVSPPLVKAWGAISQLKSKGVEGAVATPSAPAQIQTGRRIISAEGLALLLKNESAIASATVINDGTNEAGNFAKQIEIGLRMAQWQVGGDNIKMGDPLFFPDSLTLEVSATPVSPDDHSTDAAKSLKEALRKQSIECTLRFTTLNFPPNFMRIKVSTQ